MMDEEKNSLITLLLISDVCFSDDDSSREDKIHKKPKHR